MRCQHRRDQGHRNQLRRSDAGHATLEVAQVGDAVDRMFQVLQDPHDLRQESLAHLRNPHVARRPDEQAHARVVFEVLHEHAQGRLRDMQLLGSGREISCPGDGGKGAQVAQRYVHGSRICKSSGSGTTLPESRVHRMRLVSQFGARPLDLCRPAGAREHLTAWYDQLPGGVADQSV